MIKQGNNYKNSSYRILKDPKRKQKHQKRISLGRVCNSYSGWLKETKFLCAKIKEFRALGLVVNLGLKKEIRCGTSRQVDSYVSGTRLQSLVFCVV